MTVLSHPTPIGVSGHGLSAHGVMAAMTAKATPVTTETPMTAKAAAVAAEAAAVAAEAAAVTTAMTAAGRHHRGGTGQNA